MTLDLERLAEAMDRIVTAAEAHQRKNSLLAAMAREALNTTMSVEEIRERVISAGLQEALALPREPLPVMHERPRTRSYTVVAVDGSHHELDRYAAVPCAIINLGGWRIRYGEAAEAAQLSDMRVLTTATVVLDDGTASEKVADEARPDAVSARAISGPLLGAYRGAWETVFLSEQVRQAVSQAANEPLVALLDGVLLPWTVPGNDNAARDQVARMYTNAMSELRASTDGHEFALGSYISQPRAGEVMAMLGLLGPEGNGLAGHADALLFGRLLGPGQRSASFETYVGRESAPQKDHFRPQGHLTAFFYLNTAATAGGPGELARIEFPTWLANREEGDALLDLLHMAVLDQCRRNGGYPVALQEAHERAVLTTGDRMAFETLVARALEAEGIVAGTAGKQMSKRVRGL